MLPHIVSSWSHSHRNHFLRICSYLVTGALLGMSSLFAPAIAQSGPMIPGDAVITGFSGFKPIDMQPAPPDPLARFFIDADGNSVQVLRLQPSGAPQGS